MTPVTVADTVRAPAVDKNGADAVAELSDTFQVVLEFYAE